MDGNELAVRWRSTALARQSFLEHADPSHLDDPLADTSHVRSAVLESWRRSSTLAVSPDVAAAPVFLTDEALLRARQAHELNQVVPLIRRVMVEEDSGVIVAVGDAQGQLLWLDGDQAMLRHAERVHLLAGSRWTERDVGTNGIGTAIATGNVMQVFGSEHYASPLHEWSCTAAPVRDPSSGDTIGFVNISGGPQIATPQASILVRTAVAAVESELRLLEQSEPHGPRRRRAVARLSVLGRERAVLDVNGESYTLSLRHGELLLLLADRPDGISAGELAWLLYEEDAADVTLRAEMSRLRKAYPGLVSAERPYRLCRELRTDVRDVTDALRSGALDRAVELYRGAVLPRSVAPGVVDQRYYVNGWLRSALLRDADADLLLRYAYSPEGQFDTDVWRACNARLPGDSPRRAEVSAVLANLDRQLGVVG